MSDVVKRKGMIYAKCHTLPFKQTVPINNKIQEPTFLQINSALCSIPLNAMCTLFTHLNYNFTIFQNYTFFTASNNICINTND